MLFIQGIFIEHLIALGTRLEKQAIYAMIPFLRGFWYMWKIGSNQVIKTKERKI